MPKKKKTVTKVTEEFNQRLNSPMSLIAVRRQVHIQNIYGRAAIPIEILDDEEDLMMQTLFPTGDRILQDDNVFIRTFVGFV